MIYFCISTFKISTTKNSSYKILLLLLMPPIWYIYYVLREQFFYYHQISAAVIFEYFEFKKGILWHSYSKIPKLHFQKFLQ